jgi:hypothetical protein
MVNQRRKLLDYLKAEPAKYKQLVESLSCAAEHPRGRTVIIWPRRRRLPHCNHEFSGDLKRECLQEDF